MRFIPSIRRCLSAAFLISLAAASNHAPATSLAQETPVCSARFCYRSPQYLLVNYKRLRLFPRDILISGVNLNHPVDCLANPRPILFALRASSLGQGIFPQAFFNQQYVAAQLTHAQAPISTGLSAGKTSLSCYGLMFDEVRLSTGAVLTPTSTTQELFSLCDVTGVAGASEERDADMLKLAQILRMLNSTCP
jgi:hypothetical protein